MNMIQGKSAVIKLTVIVIGKNESAHIETCLKSVMIAVREMPHTELIYVDSASTDDTVAKASRYPAAIYRLHPHWQITSAAGRYIGYRKARGEFLLFIDGDTVVYKHWPAAAIRFLEAHAEAGGVGGILHEIFLDENGRRVAFRKNRYGLRPGTTQVNTFGGTAMYRRSAMDTSGSFNPWVRATPELEAALRIRRQGYRLYRIFEPMAITYAPRRETVGEVLRRANANLYAMGNTYRYCRREGTGSLYVKERMGFIIVYATVLLVSAAAAIVFLASGQYRLLLTLAAAAVGVTAVYTILRRSFYQVVLSLIKRSVILYSTVVSYLKLPVRDWNDYPLDAEVVKKRGEAVTR